MAFLMKYFLRFNGFFHGIYERFHEISWEISWDFMGSKKMIFQGVKQPKNGEMPQDMSGNDPCVRQCDVFLFFWTPWSSLLKQIRKIWCFFKICPWALDARARHGRGRRCLTARLVSCHPWISLVALTGSIHMSFRIFAVISSRRWHLGSPGIPWDPLGGPFEQGTWLCAAPLVSGIRQLGDLEDRQVW